MNKAIKTLVLAAATAGIVAVSGAPAFAASATPAASAPAASAAASGTASGGTSPTTYNLPAGFNIADQNGLRLDATGTYEIDAENLHPGDVIHKVLTLRDADTDPSTYNLTMTVEPVSHTGPDNLLKSSMLFKLIDTDGVTTKTIFDGTFDGLGKDVNGKAINASTTSLDLGSYTPNVVRTLDVTITIPSNLTMTGPSVGIDKWIFRAVKIVPAAPPKTGQQPVTYVIYAICGLMVLTMGVLFILISRNKRRAAAKPATQRSVIPAGPQFP